MPPILNAIAYLTDAKPLCDWPEAVQLVQNIGARPSAHWRISESVCQAVGGRSHEAIPAVAALIALHTSIVMVDDLLDGDGRFEAKGWSQGNLANLAQAITAAGFDAVLRGPFDEVTKNTAILHLNRMMLQTSVGQFLDTHTVIQDEIAYWQVVRAKSSPFFETAFAIGAVLGRATPEIVTALSKVGFLYGEMIQIHDDLKDALSTPAASDWQSGHGSLPILFASIVAHPERELFLQLQQDISVFGALQEAQNILLRSGAVSYCIKQLLDRGTAARRCLNNILLVDRRPVEELLDQVMRPAVQIIGSLAIPVPAK